MRKTEVHRSISIIVFAYIHSIPGVSSHIILKLWKTSAVPASR